MQFQKGQSGNPAGRPRGSRNKRTLLLEGLLHDEGESITRKLIELAKGGEMRAIGMCMDRLLPAAKGQSVACDIPPMQKPMDAIAALTAFFDAVRAGDLTPAEAAALAKLVHNWVNTMGLITFEHRLRQIEKQSGIVPPVADAPPVAADAPSTQPADQNSERDPTG